MKFIREWINRPFNAVGVAMFSFFSLVTGLWFAAPWFNAFGPLGSQIFPAHGLFFIGEGTLGSVLVVLALWQLAMVLYVDAKHIRLPSILLATWFALIDSIYIQNVPWAVTTVTMFFAVLYSGLVYLNSASLYKQDLRHKGDKGII